MQSIYSKTLSRIYGHGRGWCFSQTDFLDLAPRNTIDSSLARLEKNRVIRRVLRGLYEYPHYSKLLAKRVGPDIPKVAEALARKFRWHIVPNGPTAMHMLNLDTQVPARYEYASSGPSRSYEVDDRGLDFIHQKTQHTVYNDAFIAVLVQAIQAIGEGKITAEQLRRLASLRSAKEYNRVSREAAAATGWIQKEIRRIAVLASKKELL